MKIDKADYPKVDIIYYFLKCNYIQMQKLNQQDDIHTYNIHFKSHLFDVYLNLCNFRIIHKISPHLLGSHLSLSVYFTLSTYFIDVDDVIGQPQPSQCDSFLGCLVGKQSVGSIQLICL